ncbi:MAG: riboflavin synthase [Nitrospiraceae bacterium]|nr:MAG: riboflavin synthase [Nitrospiraceae bacterium]
MFTGLIVEMGEIVSLVRKENGARLAVQVNTLARDAALGDSISVNGTCLTVVEIKGNTLSFDLSDETLRSTNMGQLKIKDRVNLEPALRLDAKLGGHFVTGHIDGIGKMKSKTLTGDVYRIVIGTEGRIADFLVEKGSVAVDGISLTVVDVFKDGFSIVIIPHTASLTTIGFKSPGDAVNIEVDILGKYVSKFVSKGKDAGFMDTLLREGFAS